MKDIAQNTIHTLKAHGITSDLASGGACAFTIESGAGEASGSRSALPVQDAHHCAIVGVKAGLRRLFEAANAGDRIRVETIWGSQLPFLPRETGGAGLEVKAISDLIHAMGLKGISVSFHAAPEGPEPVLVRNASVALMTTQRRAAS